MKSWFIKYKHYITFSVILAVIVGLFAFAPEVMAQNQDFGISEFEEQTALGNTDLRVVIARIINVFLGLLAIILVGITLYGGFLWMTAAGNEEQVTRAKKLLGNAVIGLIIILSSWSITRFLLSRLQAAINPNQGQDIADNDPNNNCVGIACNPAGGGNEEDQCIAENGMFVVKAITPNTAGANDNNTGHKDMVVRVVFSEPVGRNENAFGAITLIDEQNNEVNIQEAEFINNRRVLEVKFSEDGGVCQFGNEISCLAEGIYTVQVNENLRSSNGNKRLRVDTPCGEFPLKAGFANQNDALDNLPPTIDPISIDGKTKENVGIDNIIILRSNQYDIQTTITDRQNGRGGIGYVKVELQNTQNENDSIVYVDAPRTRGNAHGPYELDYNFVIGARTNVPTKYDVIITGYDLAGNSIVATSSIIVVGENCQNGELDAGEEQVDVGGNCVGMGRCEADWQCASQRCVNNQCVASPIIEDVLPSWNGAAGNLITIVGRYFGQEQGNVFFEYIDGQGFERSINLLPPQCDAAADTWTDNWIITEIPVDASVPQGVSSSIRVVRNVQLRENEELYQDTSTDNRGPKPGPYNGYFIKNDVNRPGICSISDRQNNLLQGAGPNTAMIAHGNNFGQNQGELLFGRIPANVENWQNSRVFASVPNMIANDIFISVQVGEFQSNGVPFRVQAVDEDINPRITSIAPQNPTRESNITITGDGFGNGLGVVYLAPDQDTVLNCAQNPNNCKVLNTDVCGDVWGRNQVIAFITEDVDIGDYHLLLRTQDGRQSDGSHTITVRAGDPLPSICSIAPNLGPAPLVPEANPLLLFGKNFSNNPIVYYWTPGADPNNLETWLSSALHSINGENVLVSVNNNNIETLLPEANVNGQLASMQSGPIIVQSAAGEISNPVQYNVSDCRVDIENNNRLNDNDHPLIVNGYRCCIEGPDAGAWRQNGQLCEGEERTSGYVWRFTTGIIPQIPDVVEQLQCDLDNVPSPSPWSRRNDGGNDGVCLNATINTRFTLDMDANTINTETVKVFTCGNNEAPDCGNYENDVTNRFVGPLVRVNGFSLRHHANSQLEADTWYRVLLSDTIAARHNTGARDINGQPIFSTSTLRVRNELRDLPQGAAYYFDFKTGAVDGGVNGDGLCQVIDANIDPPNFTASYLGQLQDPRFVFDQFNMEHVLRPQYYYVLGRADQACIVLDVDNENWAWGSSNNAIATADKSISDEHQNDRATVTALQDSQGEPVYVTADADINGNDISGTSTLYVNLGDPKVVQAWPVPNCQHSCTNVSVGVRFNRPMITNSFTDANNNQRLRVRECTDADCDDFTDNVIRVVESISDRYIYQVDFADPAQLSVGTWYLADVPADIVSIGRVNGQQIFPGGRLTPYQWKFRIKDEDPLCRIARAEVYPDPFTAQLLGQKRRYSVVPVSAPDQCSSFGQRLNPWGYGWRWESSEVNVATISTFESQSQLPNYCTASCLYAGSSVTADNYPVGQVPSLCGDGVVGPGEDCDIAIGGEILGQSCAINCTRPGSDADSCGDGIVQTLFGEECDPGGDKSTWVGCSERCTNTGSPLPVLCGDGDITNGEDCDGGQGCSAQCLNVGSQLAQRWCDIDANRQQAGNACIFAQSVCGDGILDRGEECEILGESIRISTADRRGTIDINVGVEAALRHCSSACLLQDICALQQVPSVQQGGVRCNPDDEDCRADCHILGASVNYSVPSMCRDGVLGLGEYAGCEAVINQNVIGQNPHQVATAIGRGNVNPETKTQQTTISATVLRVRESDGSFTNVNQPVTGVGDYALQCGYTERLLDEAAFGPNIVRDGNMELPETELWENFAVAPFILKKNEDDPLSGVRRLAITVHKEDGGVGAAQEALPVEVGITYRLQFAYQLENGAEAQLVLGDAANPELQQLFPLQPGAGWQLFDRDVRFANANNVDLQFIIPRNIENFANDEQVTLYIDDVVMQAQFGGVLSTTQNDCPANNDNRLGVGNNSCCAVRPDPSASYPENGSINICRNTLLEVSFRHETIIDEDTINNNILLAEGFIDPDHECIDQDVTARVGAILAAGADVNDGGNGFFARMWKRIVAFFSNLLGIGEARAAVVHDNVEVWCSGRISIKPDIRYQWAEDNSYVTSTIGVNVGSILADDTVYALVFEGGVTGVKDVRGVSIRGNRRDNAGRFADDAYISFETGSDICRLKTVTVDPTQKLFEAPFVTSSFVAYAQSTGGGQFIQSIDGVYSWDWRWVPQNNPLFSIPIPGASTNTRATIIGSRELEGELVVSGQAVVTVDATDGRDNHTGRIFAGQSKLIADFCERPWPSRNNFPYEDDTFNFSMSYCADAGLQGITEDDLPYFIIENVINAEEIENAPGEIIEGTLRKLLFFNDQNQDVLGIQIFQNPDRLSARQWFDSKFGFGANNLQSLSIDGYDAISDGNNIYVNALNVVYSPNGSRTVYNNIYLISINEGAQPQTRQVFEQLLSSLTFNINLSNIRYCLAEEVQQNIPGNDRRIPRDTDPLISAISPAGISCNTDFDCRDIFGQALPETNGVCSNAKTKFVTDWQRIASIKASQDQLESIKLETGSYPVLAAGSFIPFYTNSRWPSWNRLGGLFTDPVNQWGACGRCSEQNADGNLVSCINDAGCIGENNFCEIQDLQTCWDAQNAQYICPQFSQITEYYADSNDSYMIHSPLTYFNENEAVISEFVSTTRYTSQPWCEPGDLHSPFAGRCGDGVVNAGEQCDPPGTAQRSNFIVNEDGQQIACAPGQQASRFCSAECTWEYSACQILGECGNGILEGDEICDDGALNGRYGQCDAPGQRENNPNTAINEALGCRSIGAAGQCRNNQLDFDDVNGNGQFDPGETAYEFCDEVGGVCQFIIDDAMKIEPILYFLIDQSGSMIASRVEDGRTRWQVITEGIPTIAQEIEGKAKIGIAVFRGANGIDRYPEILPVGFHSPEVVAQALADIGNPQRAWTTPIRSAIESLRERQVFESADPIDNSRPKSLILIVDGDADNGESPIDVITNLRTEDQIYTYVFGVGNSLDNFRSWAIAGGTDNFFRVDQPQEFRNRMQNVTRCYEYSLRPGNTCSLTCQSYGGYCGDGVVQAANGEQCDDGNFIDDDGCSNTCQINEAVVNQQIAGSCGDGVVQSPNRNGVAEVCDMGNQNGIACTPEYGSSCSYCSRDCRSVLSVDPIAYCGNGVIDIVDYIDKNIAGRIARVPVYEACDVLVGSNQVINSDGIVQCFDNTNPFVHRGSISCSDDCRVLVNNCVDCGIIPLPGAEPRLTIVNVLENPSTPGEFKGWLNDNFSYYFVRRTSNEWIQRLSTFGINRADYSRNSPLLTDNILFGDEQNGTPPRRIDANALCTDVYKVAFNPEEIANATLNPANDYRIGGPFVGSRELDQLVDRNSLGLMSYPVDNQNIRVDNTIFVSPAVPSNHMRIVVRYEQPNQNNLVSFTGNLFSNKYLDEFIVQRGGRLSYMDALARNNLCNTLRLIPDGEMSNAGYYMPHGCDGFDQSMTMSRLINSNNQFAQATTVILESGPNPDVNNLPIAFFVAAVMNQQNDVSISSFRDSNVRVEVYMHHPNANPTYSILPPDYVFELNRADRSDNAALARYWHPFNIIREADGSYRLYTPDRANAFVIEVDNNNLANLHGSVETDYVDVLCNVPGQACNRAP